MENRKINIDRKPLSSEEIAKSMNFEALMAQHQVVAKPWYKSGWAIGGSAVGGLLLVASLVLLYINSGETPAAETSAVSAAETVQAPEASEATVPFVNPVPQVYTDARVNYTVDAELGAELVFVTGSVIRIPAHAFLDASGTMISGKVEVRYTEYHDPVDFMASGVDMTYDSAGVKHSFSSAGMLGIEAYQNGKPVYANPDNLIQIAVASAYDGDHYNLYYLDTTNKAWAFQGKDDVYAGAPEMYETERLLAMLNELEARHKPQQSIVDVDLQNSRKQALENELEALELDLYHMRKKKAHHNDQPPQQPARFDIDVLESEFPELAAFKEVEFELGLEPENNDFDTSDYYVEWDDVQLQERDKGVNYTLTLSKGQLSKTFVVYPVEKNSNTDATLAYQNQLRAFSAAKVSYADSITYLESQIQTLKKDLKTLKRAAAPVSTSAMDATRLKALEAARSQVQLEEAYVHVIAKTTRIITIDKFGFWNIDAAEHPHEMGKRPEAFTTAAVETVAFERLFLLDFSSNGLLEITEEWPLDYGNNAKVKLVGITQDGQMYHADFLSEGNITELSAVDKEGDIAVQLREIDLL